MKKIITTLFTLFTALTLLQGQQKLAVGMKAPEWKFTDADKVEFTMDSWAGKVLQVNYVDPDESELNEPFNEAVNKAVDVDKRISRDNFKGFGIVDTKSTWKPNSLIRSIAGKKAKKFNTTILFDYDGTLQTMWGLPKDNYSVVILDKNRICRYIHSGRIAESDNEKIIQLILQLSKE
ncbi:MAG TPA: YtfJ family protein [Bacteroidales bacterium]|nr:YtfJ family protein [Bacteroidales bacterium]